MPLHHHLELFVYLRVFGLRARGEIVLDCIRFRTLRRHGTLMFLLVERLQVSADRFTWPHRPRALNLHMHINLTPRRARALLILPGLLSQLRSHTEEKRMRSHRSHQNKTPINATRKTYTSVRDIIREHTVRRRFFINSIKTKDWNMIKGARAKRKLFQIVLGVHFIRLQIMNRKYQKRNFYINYWFWTPSSIGIFLRYRWNIVICMSKHMTQSICICSGYPSLSLFPLFYIYRYLLRMFEYYEYYEYFLYFLYSVKSNRS